jgi:hypothetical protein
VIITLSSLKGCTALIYLTSLTPMITSHVGSSLQQLLNVLALNGEKERKRERKEEKKKIDGG